jgi:type IV pilus assembly protein PilA
MKHGLMRAPVARPLQSGFTLMEIMIVVAIIAILALIAIPTQTDRIVQQQVVEGLELTQVVTEPVGAYWRLAGKLDGNNDSLKLPEASKIVSNRVQSVTYDNGAVHMRFGNQASGALKGKTLSLRAAVVEGESRVPITWLCHKATAPQGMSVKGDDRTDIEVKYLPLRCR